MLVELRGDKVEGLGPGGLHQFAVAPDERGAEAVVGANNVHPKATLDAGAPVVEAKLVVGADFVHLVAGGTELDSAADGAVVAGRLGLALPPVVLDFLALVEAAGERAHGA